MMQQPGAVYTLRKKKRENNIYTYLFAYSAVSFARVYFYS